MRNSYATSSDTIPIIHLWGNLLVPLQGDISDSQGEWLRTELLRRVRATDVTGLVIDVSGVSVIDSHLCALLANLAAAVQLMGVASVLCGLSPEIVMTLQSMAIEIDNMEATLSLEEALERLGGPPERSLRSSLEQGASEELEDLPYRARTTAAKTEGSW